MSDNLSNKKEYSFSNLNDIIKLIVKLWEKWFTKSKSIQEIKSLLTTYLTSLSKIMENYFSNNIKWDDLVDDIGYEINSGSEKNLYFLYQGNYDMKDPMNDIFDFSTLIDDLKKIPYLMHNGNFKKIDFEYDGHRTLDIKIKTIEPKNKIEGIALGSSLKKNYKLSDNHEFIKIESSYSDNKTKEKSTEVKYLDINLLDVDTFCFALFNKDDINIKLSIREMWVKGNPVEK